MAEVAIHPYATGTHILGACCVMKPLKNYCARSSCVEVDLKMLIYRL